MKTHPLTLAAVVSAGLLLHSPNLRAAGFIAVDFDAGQTTGSRPVGPIAITPATNSGSAAVTVVSGTGNPAGGGVANGIRILDTGGSGAGVEYNFVNSLGAQVSSFRVDFDIAQLSSGAAGNYMTFGLGEYNSSTSLRLNTSGQRFIEADFTADGKANFLSATGTDSNNNALLAGHNHVTIFVNDLDSAAVTYARPDTGLGQSLPANSVAYWLNANLILTTTLDTADTTAGGTVGTSEHNFGRAGWVTYSAFNGLDWNVDNFAVTELPAVATGTTRFVTDAASFNALPKLNAGDVVVMRNGAYGALNKGLDTSITSDAVAQSNPIIIRAETPGGVDVTAPSALILKSKGITLAGLDFLSTSGMIDNSGTNPVYLIQTAQGSSYHKLSNIRLLNSGAGDDYGYWVFLSGYHHTVEYCSFEGKNEPNGCPVLCMKGFTKTEADMNTQRLHAVRYCYFGPRECEAGSGGNGYETIRIGDSDSQAIDMHCTVEQNLFYHSIWRSDATPAGEVEVISNKSVGNQILNNTLLETQGEICLRTGDSCVVDGNYILGGGTYSGTTISLNPATGLQGGIRVLGYNHIVRNNHLVNLSGSSLGAALSVLSGSLPFVVGTGTGGQAGYKPANNAQIYNNTMIDCYEMNLGLVHSGTFAPTGVQLYNNAWQGNSGSYGIRRNNNFTQAGSGQNYIYGPTGNYGWTGLTGGVYTTATPDISVAFDNYLIPSATSPLLNLASPTLVAAKDVRGLTRPAGSEDIGSFEKQVSGSGKRPLLRSEVGPIFDGGPAGTYP